MVTEKKLEKPIPPEDVKSASTLSRRIWLFIAIVLTLVLVWVGSIYATSPNAIRNPSFDHYHFRMQLLVDGKAVNFADERYQATYEKGNCNVELTDRPIHFHDNKNQFVHIHWDNISGGMVLKNYGWNFIGGSDGSLGYRFDELGSIKNISVHSSSLPNIPRDSEFYVFMGDEISFVERSFDQFKSQNLESFFGKKSNLSTNSRQNFLDFLLPKVSAHGEVNDGHDSEPAVNNLNIPAMPDLTNEELKRMNNLLGNVVIFVQANRPSFEQVKERFQELEPLSSSTCGG